MTNFLLKTAALFKRFFFLFLDISGILLGVFLIVLGSWILAGRPVSTLMGFVILLLGIGAFIIHLGHYFHLKIVKWIFGPDYFLMPPGKADPERNKPNP